MMYPRPPAKAHWGPSLVSPFSLMGPPLVIALCAVTPPPDRLPIARRPGDWCQGWMAQTGVIHGRAYDRVSSQRWLAGYNGAGNWRALHHSCLNSTWRASALGGVADGAAIVRRKLYLTRV
ncbi:hypothetical protein BD779DRAFT_1575983 [Infundibulicybe gibba]|nr:hypothetical protein BD779DRAFT_1575983 [Infundibulicybe gibba]